LLDRQLAGVGKTTSQNRLRCFVIKDQSARRIDNEHGHRETACQMPAQNYLDLFGKHTLPPSWASCLIECREVYHRRMVLIGSSNVCGVVVSGLKTATTKIQRRL